MGFSTRAERPSLPELTSLYQSVGWSAYTVDPTRLKAAIDGSHLVLCARDSDGTLLGLARTVSDGNTIVYLQDLLVSAEHQREGIGGALLDEVLDRSRDIRQLVRYPTGCAVFCRQGGDWAASQGRGTGTTVTHTDGVGQPSPLASGRPDGKG
jgi:GNAT superfamily N-acetyltransferase